MISALKLAILKAYSWKFNSNLCVREENLQKKAELSMSKKFISLLVVFLLSPILSAGQDAAEESRTLMPRGWTPALEQAQIFIEEESADKNGFSLPLSALVIYDSSIHSGSILYFLRQRFPEMPPAKGGDEKTWIRQYVDVRQDWLANHQLTILHATIYRAQCFKGEMARDNWDLSQFPVDANGVDVFGD
jgi:hypothetical protein